MPGTQQAAKEYAMRNKNLPRVALEIPRSRPKKKTLKDMPKEYVFRLFAFGITHYGTAAVCWLLPALLAFSVSGPWWQGAAIGYAAAGSLMTAYLWYLQSRRRRMNLRPILLGAVWPYASSLFYEPYALADQLEPF